MPVPVSGTIEEDSYFQEKLNEFHAKYAEFESVLAAVLGADVREQQT